jgi:hypothetical protein
VVVISFYKQELEKLGFTFKQSTRSSLPRKIKVICRENFKKKPPNKE